MQLFSDAFGKLLKAVEKQSKEAGAGKINRLTYKLPEPLAAAVKGFVGGVARAGQGEKALGRETRRSGPARMKRSGSAGSASPTASWPISSA